MHCAWPTTFIARRSKLADPTILALTMADDRYAMPLAAMGRSLFEHHRSGRPIELTIVDGGVSAGNRERIERSWRGAARSPAKWRWTAPIYGAAPALPVWGRMPPLTYARLQLHEYFPDSRERAILLDSDTLVLSDVAELYDVDLEDNIAAACLDPFLGGARARGAYLNAGVMVTDLRLWRKERVGEQALAALARARRPPADYDQGPLNLALAGRWKRLHRSWNVQPRTANALGVALPDKPRIFHFSGRLKPWAYEGDSPADRLYYEFIERTEWRGFRPPRTLGARAMRLYDAPSRRYVHFAERRMMALYEYFRMASAARGRSRLR